MKDAYYFSHDSNAIQDPKMMTLLTECGVFGVGLYWIIIEVLHQQEWGGIGVADLRHYINFYGKQGSWDDHTLNRVEQVFYDTKLLILDGDMVYSQRVKNNLKKRHELSEIGRKNSLKRWGDDATALATQSNPNAIKERKGKERYTPKPPKGFDEFWKVYPKKVGKGAAEKAWKTQFKTKGDAIPLDIIPALLKQKKKDQWQKDGGQFIPNPATWLNQKRWLDEGFVDQSQPIPTYKAPERPKIDPKDIASPEEVHQMLGKFSKKIGDKKVEFTEDEGC